MTDNKTAKTADGCDFASFSIDDPVLPKQIRAGAFKSGAYPYDKRMKRKAYETELKLLQIELVKLQYWVRKSGARIVILFEGRDAAGKGGTIKRFMQYLNPRHASVVALSKPTETERGQWYFQRYIQHLPTQGDIVLFDRSWYNRAGVERVMGFCTGDELRHFFAETPSFENMLVREGIQFYKFWLTVGREMQLKRFHARRHDPLRQWKLSSIDLATIPKWRDFTTARDDMFQKTHSKSTPWTVIRSNDKRRARLAALKHVLSTIDYDNKNNDVVSAPDPLILGTGSVFFEHA